MKKFLKNISVWLIALVMIGAVGCDYFDENIYLNKPIVNNVTVNNVNIINSTTTESYSSIADVVDAVYHKCVVIDTTIVSGTSTARAAGSGVILTVTPNKDALFILTCQHVIESANSITVTLSDDSKHNATLQYADADNDLAVLYMPTDGISASDLESKYTAVEVAPTTYNLRLGETSIVIGNPLGTLGGSVTSGIISSKSRTINVEDTVLDLIQTDAAINSGNSGGGMFNMSGALIGIVDAKVSSSGVDNIGFAIPYTTINAVAPKLIDKSMNHPALGIGVYYVYDRDSALTLCSNFTKGTEEYDFWMNKFIEAKTSSNFWGSTTTYSFIGTAGIYVINVTNPASGLQKGYRIEKISDSTSNMDFNEFTSHYSNATSPLPYLTYYLNQRSIGDVVTVHYSDNAGNSNQTTTVTLIARD